MLDAWANALSIVAHSVSPQLSMETSFSALSQLPLSQICVKSPVMLTV